MAFYFYWIEHTTLSIWLRESTSLLALPTVLLIHTVAMGFLAGSNAAIDLCVLGVSPQLRIGPLRKYLPFMWTAFWVATLTGGALVVAYPTQSFTNKVFYAKLLIIVLAVANTVALNRAVFGHGDTVAAGLPMRRFWKVLAVMSLVLWAGAIVAGRLLPYTSSPVTTSSY